LEKEFNNFGKINDFKVKDKGGGNIFAFIEFEDVRDAEDALKS